MSASDGGSSVSYDSLLSKFKSLYSNDPPMLDYAKGTIDEYSAKGMRPEDAETDIRALDRCVSLYRSLFNPLCRNSNMIAALDELEVMRSFKRQTDDRFLTDMVEVVSALLKDVKNADIGRGRDIKVFMDRSKYMRGEPNVISLAVFLVLYRIFGHGREVDLETIGVFTDLKFDDSSEGARSFIDLITSQPDADPCGSLIPGMLLDMMKSEELSDCDVVVLTKAEGLMNSLSFTSEWKRWKSQCSVRVFTIVPGANDPKGMTELSDGFIGITQNNLSSLNGEFGSMIESIGSGYHPDDDLRRR